MQCINAKKSGIGESLFLDFTINSYLSTGAKVRVINVGKSYKKVLNMLETQFIHFSKSNVVLNFFEGIGDIDNLVIPENATAKEREEIIRNQQEDYADKMFMLTGVIATMASKTNDPATPEQITLIETAIREVYKIKKNTMTIDDVIHWLAHMEVTDDRHKKMAEEGYYLSLALAKYGSKGEYGHYFYGKSNINFSTPLVVAELDGVPKDLQKVFALAFASMIKDEIYNGNKMTQTITITILN